MQRRNFLRVVIPLAIVVGTAIEVFGHEGRVTEMVSHKRYVFSFSGPVNQETCNAIKKHLEGKGFKDPIVFGGQDIKIYELPA